MLMMTNRSCVCFLSILLAAAYAGRVPAQDLAITNARIYTAPHADPISNGSILVRDGHIVAVGSTRTVRIPEDAPRIDADGAVVTAGFWNSHVHTIPLPLREGSSRPVHELEASLAQFFTRWGFTTVFDIGSVPAGNSASLRGRIGSGELKGPALLTADVPFFPQDSTPVYVRELFEALGVDAEVSTDEEARERARHQLHAGADGVKLFIGAIVGGPQGVVLMDADIATAIVDEAHQANAPAFAHPTSLKGIELALESGVDVLSHTAPEAGPWPEALAARLVREDMAITPTLMLFEIEVRKEGAPQAVADQVVAIAQQQLKAFHDAGGQVLFGTDVGYIDDPDTTREFELMAASGLAWEDVLASLTTNPSRRFGQSGRKGRIAVGMDADLVILAADPARDIRAFADVSYTIKDGRVIYQADDVDAAPAAHAPATGSAGGAH